MMPNWKSPGPDLVWGFWLKNFNSLHERVRLQLKECLDSGFRPSSGLGMRHGHPRCYPRKSRKRRFRRMMKNPPKGKAAWADIARAKF